MLVNVLLKMHALLCCTLFRHDLNKSAAALYVDRLPTTCWQIFRVSHKNDCTIL